LQRQIWALPAGAMGQVSVILNGRSYRFNCEDGEEARLKELVAYVKGRVDALSREFGSVGEERLVLMAAILITDELWDTRAEADGSVDGGDKETAEEEKPSPRSSRVDFGSKQRTASSST